MNEEAKKRLHGWRLLAVISGGLLALTIGVGFWWYFDDSDLKAVRDDARRRGYAVTWKEMKLVVSDEARLACWKDIVRLSKKLKSYQSGPGLKMGAAPYKVFLPIPEGMRTHHAGFDAADLTALMAQLDALGDQPLILRQEMDYNTSIPEIGVRRDLLRLLQERVALAEADEVSRLCRRILAFCRSYSVDCAINHAVASSVTDIALLSISLRLDDLRQRDPAIADVILATAQHLPSTLPTALECDFLCLQITVGQRQPFDLNRSILADHVSLPAWLTPVIVRAGRRDLLNSMMEAMDQLHGTDLASDLAWTKANELSNNRRVLPTPGNLLRKSMNSVYSTMCHLSHFTALRGRLLAAEIHKQPWPVDVFDPTRQPLRRLERDGKLMGAYSVGTDGLDNGGKPGDRYFGLYGPREAPAPATP